MKLLRPTRLICCSASLLLAGLAAVSCHGQDQKRGRKYKDPPPVAHISILVTRASNGKPVENASVIFHTFHEGKDRETWK